jgi:hypothetical protein
MKLQAVQAKTEKGLHLRWSHTCRCHTAPACCKPGHCDACQAHNLLAAPPLPHPSAAGRPRLPRHAPPPVADGDAWWAVQGQVTGLRLNGADGAIQARQVSEGVAGVDSSDNTAGGGGDNIRKR